MFYLSSLLFALTAGAGIVHSASVSTYFGAPFNIGNGDSFGIPGNATFDYVVVGGGTTGLAVAMRLAEDGTHTVAVIEAGGFHQLEAGNKSVVPAYNPLFANLQAPNADPLIDWGFVTAPQPGANNRTMHYARGKTSGGTSALNANQWANLVGDDSYTFDNWLPYFAKGVNHTVPNDIRAANATVPTPSSDAVDFSPSGGPLHVSHSNFALPFSTWVQRAFQYFGFANVTNFSNGELLGSHWAPNVLQPISNERETSSTAYLNAALDSNRTKVQLFTHAMALHVLFSENKTATGVLVRSGRLDYVPSAQKEVVVSAGAFQSPQLLMVSGIGPAARLQQHDIPVLVDRAGVGQNMWDHVDIEVTYKVDLIGQNTLKNATYAQEQKDAYHAIPAKSIYGNVQAVKRARSILASPALDPIRLGSEVAPGEAINTDALLEQYIRNNFFMNWHTACTCKMGRTNDTTAVVDSKARVIGVQNLRVVDASAFALLPPGHPVSMVYGLAEKISADHIGSR